MSIEQLTLIEKVDEVTNVVMDVFRDFLGYATDDEEGDIKQVIASHVSGSPADFDDELYTEVHGAVLAILPSLIKKRNSQSSEQPK